jgi:hypoxanthine phosphoribosyltransferase
MITRLSWAVLGLPTRLNQDAVERLARQLTRDVARFGPTAVIYVHRGGAVAGRALARALGIPCHRLDVRYPATRLLRRLPQPLAALAFPLKELSYRLTAPRVAAHVDGELPDPRSRVVLVDDSASTGRTIRAALAALEQRGFDRSRMRVAVIRCGTRARDVVNWFALDDPVRFEAPP